MLVAAAVTTLSIPAFAATPTVRSARVTVAVTSPSTCDVSMALTVDGGSPVEHRLQAFGGTKVELTALRGARQLGDVRTVGQTHAILIEPDDPEYLLAYHVSLPADFQYRCPLWLPIVPTTGRPGAVQLDVDIPAGSRSGDTLPAFAWAGTHGTASLAHLPAAVRTTYGPADSRRGWTLARTMDAVTLAVFAASSLVWLWRVKR